jgi:transcriptional regulator with XRE-family HTH domain
MKTTLPSIPEALRTLQKQIGIKQGPMAGLLGMAPTHYSELLHGKRPITRKTMVKAYRLGVPAEVLLQEIKND